MHADVAELWTVVKFAWTPLCISVSLCHIFLFCFRCHREPAELVAILIPSHIRTWSWARMHRSPGKRIGGHKSNEKSTHALGVQPIHQQRQAPWNWVERMCKELAGHLQSFPHVVHRTWRFIRTLPGGLPAAELWIVIIFTFHEALKSLQRLVFVLPLSFS